MLIFVNIVYHHKPCTFNLLCGKQESNTNKIPNKYREIILQGCSPRRNGKCGVMREYFEIV